MSYRRLTRKCLQQLLGIAVISGCLALGVNFARQNSLEILGPAPLPVEANAIIEDTDVAAGVQEISLDEAIDHFRRGTALFVDARAAEDFTRGHIDGAISVPDQQFDDYIGPFLAATASETTLITYCDGNACSLSRRLAEKLILAGFERVYYLRDGWGEWIRNDLPTSEGNY